MLLRTTVCAILLAASPVRAETVRRCVGSGGEILYTDRECPQGSRLDADLGSTAGRADGEPYFCEAAGTLGPYEAESAIKVAESSLAAADPGAGQSESASRWRSCLEALRERKRVLEAAGAAAAPAAPAVPPKEQAAAPSPCRNGSFRTENGSLSFEVFFTNLGSAPCAGVDGYCLFHLFTGGPGDYRESGTVHFEGVVPPGGTVSLGEVSSKGGPANRSIAWAWCRIR